MVTCIKHITFLLMYVQKQITLTYCIIASYIISLLRPKILLSRGHFGSDIKGVVNVLFIHILNWQYVLYDLEHCNLCNDIAVTEIRPRSFSWMALHTFTHTVPWSRPRDGVCECVERHPGRAG